jgi:dTDP-4-amino-4,6-dideoxygalactose transaminase
MCLSDLESKLTPTTKVIVVVHWGGSPVDLARLAAIQQRCFDKFGFRPAVIEVRRYPALTPTPFGIVSQAQPQLTCSPLADIVPPPGIVPKSLPFLACPLPSLPTAVPQDCAHAFGAEFGGKKLGSHGNLCCFSLQAIKHLTAIDGGVLIAPTSRLFERAKLCRWFGIDRERRSGGGDFRMEPPIEEYGFKFHMNDVNATVGLASLRHVPSILEACRANGAHLQQQLAGLRHLTLLDPLPTDSVSSFWLFTLRVERLLRPSLMAHLKQRGIAASAVHQRNDVHPCVAQFATRLPQLNILADEVLCLPVGWWVGPAERERIVQAVRGWTEMPAQRMLDTGLAWGTDRQRKRCVITGGCGFIGHHVVEHFVKNTVYDIVVLDKLSYASKGYDRLRDSGVFHLIQTHCVDLSSPIPPGLAYEIDAPRVEVVLHIAAEVPPQLLHTASPGRRLLRRGPHPLAAPAAPRPLFLLPRSRPGALTPPLSRHPPRPPARRTWTTRSTRRSLLWRTTSSRR